MGGVAQMRTSALFRKTLVGVLLLFGSVIGVTSIFSDLSLRRLATNEYRSKGSSIASSIASSSVEIMLNQNAETLQAIIDQFLDIEGVSYVYIVDDTGAIVAHTFAPRIPDQILRDSDPGEVHTGIHKEQVVVKDVHIAGMGDMMDISSPILAGLAGHVHVGMDYQTIRRQVMRAIRTQVFLVFVIFLVGIGFAYLFVNQVSRPLVSLASCAGQIAAGDFEVSLPEPRSKDEVGTLTRDFRVMQDSLKDHIRQLTETTAARERMESELRIAHDIQMSILPKTFPPFPAREEFDLYALIAPAREVGGDFYDFFRLDDDLLCFVIGDVSGKGVPAALFMAVTKTMIKSVAKDDVTPDAILSLVNQELAADNEACMFVTLFCGLFDMKTGEIRYANAGHNPPLVIKKDETVEWLPRSRSLVAGAMPGVQYQCDKLLLSPGDSLYLYTDGVTEAMNPAGELYSEERLEENLSSLAERDITDIIHEVTDSVHRFADGAPQSDDITMMMIRYFGK
jgi:serine phosphatase RsbU (regulator of sigma subunit)/HAMP domain-containing protein